MVLYNEMFMFFFLTCLRDRDVTLAFAEGLDARGRGRVAQRPSGICTFTRETGAVCSVYPETTVLEMPEPTSQLVAKS